MGKGLHDYVGRRVNDGGHKWTVTEGRCTPGGGMRFTIEARLPYRQGLRREVTQAELEAIRRGR